MHRLGVDYTKVPTPTAALESEARRLSSEATACCNCNGAHVTTTKEARGAVTHVLMDIEGTTTSISFVHDTLFPYAAAAVGEHLR